MHFIVKLFPEITIKSRPVRQRMIRLLRENLRTLLRTVDPGIEVQKGWDRLEITTPDDSPEKEQQITDLLQRTPGISNVIQVVDYPAILVTIDGEPQLREIEGTSFEYVVNTPFLLVKDGRTLYLYIGSNAWYRGREVTDEVIDGPRSIVFDQAENRMHVEKAILLQFLAE